MVTPRQRIDEKSVRLLPGVTVRRVLRGTRCGRMARSRVDANALRGMKFSSALPEKLAKQTLGSRVGDKQHAAAVLAESRSFLR